MNGQSPAVRQPPRSGKRAKAARRANSRRRQEAKRLAEEARDRPSAGPSVTPGPAESGRADEPAGAAPVSPGPGQESAPEPVSLADRLEIDEPILAARVHRPGDLIRSLFGLLGIALVLLTATFAVGTTEGIETDINNSADGAPPLLISFAGFASSVAVLIVPVAFAVERLIKRDGLRIADGVLAAVLAHGVSLSFSLWVARVAPESVQNALTRDAPSGVGLTDPVHGYLAPVIAYATAVGMTHRPRWRLIMIAVLMLDAVSVLVAGYTTLFSILVTVLIGWTIAYGTLYAVGTPNVRPTGQQLLAGLRNVGFRPVSALRTEEPPGSEAAESGDSEAGQLTRRYLVTLETGPPLDITVVDRAQQAQGFFYRAWRRLTVRGITQRRSLPSLRQALEQEALLAYAAIAAGAHAPKLIATSELGPDAVMLVYEHIGGRSLESVPADEITDDLMAASWQQVVALQSRRIAHRRLDGHSLLVDRAGQVYLTNLRGGEIAAGDIPLRMDVAQLLTTFGLRVGAERAVASAVAVLGPDAVADSLPMLQPIAMSRTTRTTLRQLGKERAARERQAVLDAVRAYREARGTLPEDADRKTVKAAKQAEKQVMEQALEDSKEPDLLSLIRQQVLRVRPEAAIEPARMERVRPRTLVSFIAAAFAGYFLITQLAELKIDQVIDNANWWWVIAAACFSALTYFSAAVSLLGFVPEKVPYLRTVVAQVAGSFVKLVAPAAIGGVALNTRYLQRQGLRPGHAVASVGASQLFGLGSHITLLLTFGYLTGTEHTPNLSPSRTVIAGLLTVAVLALIVAAVPALRKTISERVQSLFAGVVPRMLDVVQEPKKLLSGIGGMLLMTMAFVLCLDASLQAFGVEMSYPTVAVVFLAGNALGSAAPTPGGIGAVELALTGALAAFGAPTNPALAAVLLFRLMTFWLPVLPGWLAFTHLTRKEAL
ncbi:MULTISPECIES: lysylphosphatidylglycerol synthase transmembrane domain-containing protein [Streptomyces]|uniref:lysylphosphatidylglycerol synthase transmembrane domain-containing protein n=1 Tax=Streptomyces TaxID=1883 RepID=UPI000376D20C|nr:MULTISPECIES: lysylphosphatidylglycerol synthase transmembrane domain-containing protein [Streptomyces]QKV70560.1 flippase-like domain-containing protein [Streptomyces harbinensis]